MAFSLTEKLFSNEPRTKTMDVMGRQITFKILSTPEEVEVVREAAADNFLVMLESRKIPTLARAIVAIDGEKWDECTQIKQRLQSFPGTTLVRAVEQELSQPQYSEEVISALYMAYSEFQIEFRAELKALKKTSTTPSPETVG